MSRPLIPRLHLITNDAILARADFLAWTTDILLALQQRVAVHVRAHDTAAADLFDVAALLARRARVVQALCVVNDRVDLALATGANAVQLGARSLGVATVRSFLPPEMLIGYSAHEAAEAVQAQQAGADFLLAGTIYPTASHPEGAVAGLPLLTECAQECTAPVLAIGGITAARVPDVLRTGAYGVAVIRAVWDAPDPLQAAGEIARMLYE